jgi:hypothetical protein
MIASSETEAAAFFLSEKQDINVNTRKNNVNVFNGDSISL